MKAEVSGNAIELSLSRGDAISLAISMVFVIALLVLAGWPTAFVALGVSLLGAGMVEVVQRSDVKIFGR
jgi:hypothetical protein